MTACPVQGNLDELHTSAEPCWTGSKVVNIRITKSTTQSVHIHTMYNLRGLGSAYG